MANNMNKLKDKNKARLCIDMPSDAHRKLKVYSVTHGKNMGDIVAKLIHEFLTMLEEENK